LTSDLSDFSIYNIYIIALIDTFSSDISIAREAKMNTTLVLIPGLLSDARVWQPLADVAGIPNVMQADVTQDADISTMASRILENTTGHIISVGHSMGGRVAMEVARQAPNRVRALVLANTGHHPLQDGETEKRISKINQGHSDFPAMVKSWLPPMMAASRHNDTALVDNLTEMAMAMGPDIHERQVRALMARPDAGAYIAQIPCLILLLTGTQDVWSPEAQHREIQNMAQNGELQVVENAGHFLPIEQPLVTTKIVTEWIKAQKGILDD
jgi:pimeloyl-ACP methyl ester carboxylesterase